MSKTLEKVQATIGALETRLTKEKGATAKAEERLSRLKAQWGDLAEGDNNDKAMAANEGQQSKAETEIKRASRRIEGLHKRLARATAELRPAQFDEAVAELGRLEQESIATYKLYRKQATELVALAGVLDGLERQAGSVASRAGASANGRPCPKPRMRRGFEPGGGSWHHQYGDQGLVRYLAWLRRCEGVLGWAD